MTSDASAESALGDGMSLVTLADRPELLEGFLELDRVWPRFMLQDPYGHLLARPGLSFAHHMCALVDSAGTVVGRSIAVPVPWWIDDELPARGWDVAIEAAVEGLATGAQPQALCALEITLSSATQGRGLSEAVLRQMRVVRAREEGLGGVVAPVRPTGKAQAQRTPMSEYVKEFRSDGMPSDPWLRIHARLGAEICNVADFSLVITGSFGEWHEWTGVDLAATAELEVELPGGLTPLLVNRAEDTAVYVEPNVWCRHRSTRASD